MDYIASGCERRTRCAAVLFPSCKGEQPLIGIPLTNPMGWCKLPPNFSACTETVASLANANLTNPTSMANVRSNAHRFNTISESVGGGAPSTGGNAPSTAIQKPSPASSTPTLTLLQTPTSRNYDSARFCKPLQYRDIYVDDLCGLCQGNKWQRQTVKRILFHALDQVFRPVDSTNKYCRQEPASIKKLLKGDARWMTSKIILWWLIDTVSKTIRLPAHPCGKTAGNLQYSAFPKDSLATRMAQGPRGTPFHVPGNPGISRTLLRVERSLLTPRGQPPLSSTLQGYSRLP